MSNADVKEQIEFSVKVALCEYVKVSNTPQTIHRSTNAVQYLMHTDALVTFGFWYQLSAGRSACTGFTQCATFPIC